MQQKIVYAGVNSASFRQAGENLRVLADLEVPVKQVQRLTRRIGAERVAERDAVVQAFHALPLVDKHATPKAVTVPEVAAVMVDGGRLQLRDAEPEEVEHEPGVCEATAESTEPKSVTHRGKHWREDRVALLLRLDSAARAADPCPHIPEHFVDPTRIVKLARELKPVRLGEEAVAEPTPEAESAQPEPGAEKGKYPAPEVVERRVVASRHCWDDFGPIVAQAARADGLLGAARKAFVGDGAENNWTIWRRFFGSFVPILDFIHALSSLASSL